MSDAQAAVSIPGGAAETDESTSLRLRAVRRLQSGGNYPAWVLAAALAGMFATTFPVTILSVSLSTIAAEFRTQETTIAWVVTAPMLFSAVAIPLLGKMGDLYGHRRVFMTGFGFSTACALLSAFAWDPFSLIAFRTLSAVVGAATQPTSMALLFTAFPQKDRVRAMGWWSMTGAAAPAIGLVAGGPLIDLFGWRIVFMIQTGLSFAAWLFAGFVLPETGRRPVKFDVPGALALAAGVGGLMFAIGEVKDFGFGSPWIWFAFAAGLAGIWMFQRIERTAEAPLLPLRFFGLRNFSAPMTAIALQNAAFMGAMVLAPMLLIRQFGLSASAAAGIVLIRTLSLSVSSPAGGRLGMKFGERAAAMTGCLVTVCALLLLASGAATSAVWIVGAGLLLQGVGNGLSLPSLTTAVSNSVEHEHLGVASAANRLSATVGAAIGITLLTAVYSAIGGTRGFVTAFVLAGVLSGLSMASSSRMHAAPEDRRD